MIICGSCDDYEKARKKAAEEHMSLDGNPLRRDVDWNDYRTQQNMERLLEDARSWNDPLHGHAYRAIFGMKREEE